MGAPWPSAESRDAYVKFLELELRVMRSAAHQELDPELLESYSRLLCDRFPRTRAFMESRLSDEEAPGLADEMRTVAWAEARARPGGGGAVSVEGAWTPEEIAADINDCFREALERAGF